MKKLKWITVSNYVDEDTGEELTRAQVNKNYIIKKKDKHVQKTEYNKWYNDVVGAYNYKGITTITNVCTRNGKQLSIFTD